MSLLLLLAMLCVVSQALNDFYQLQVQPVMWAQEGLCVFVPCNFTYPKESWYTTTYGYWYRQYQQYGMTKNEYVASNDRKKPASSRTQQRFQLAENLENGNCSLFITDVQKRDKGLYYFQVERGESVQYSYFESMVSLEVTVLTQLDIYILETLWPNRLGTVICVFNATFEGCPAPSFFWTGPILSTSRPQVSTHRSSVLKIIPRPQDHGTFLTSSVRFAPQGRIFQKTVRLDVACAPKSLVIHVSWDKGAAPQFEVKGAPSFHLQVQQGSFLQLLCEASSQPPASLSWAQGDRVLVCSQPEDPRALALELPSVQVGDGGNYTCRAKNALGQGMLVIHLEVQHPPEDLSVMVSIENGTVLQTLQKANTIGVLQGQSLQLRCIAHSSPPARLSWTRGLIPQSPVLPTEPGFLLLPRIRPDEEGEFICQAHNNLGSQQVSVTIHVYSSPQLLGLHCSWKASALRCSCLAIMQ